VLEQCCSQAAACDVCQRTDIEDLKADVNGVSAALGTYETCMDTTQQLDLIEDALEDMRNLRQTIIDTGHLAWRDAVVAVGPNTLCPMVPIEFCDKMINLAGEQLCIKSGMTCVNNSK